MSILIIFIISFNVIPTMGSPQVVETSVTNNSPPQGSNHPDNLFQARYIELLGSNHFS